MRDNLKNVRLERKLTVDEIAEQLGITPSSYYKIEAGIRNPSIYLARRIAILLNKNIEQLFFNK